MLERDLLIVDDEEIILNTLEQVFKLNGYTPYCSLNGVGALELMEAHNIQVIFTDLRMPEMDGMELCRLAKEKNPDASVFALSAYVDNFSEAEFQEAGFRARFRKPFSIDALLQACADGFDTIEAKTVEQRMQKDTRRKHYRLVLDDRIIASVLNSKADRSLVGKTMDCTNCTVSAGGIEMMVDCHVEKDADLQLHVGVGGNPRAFLLDGVVRWTVTDEWALDSEKRTKIGVQFMETSRDYEAWGKFVNRPQLRKHIVWD